jgi:hypothetical protein
MSEQSGGPGWWLASDGKWYPPPMEALPPPPPPPGSTGWNSRSLNDRVAGGGSAAVAVGSVLPWASVTTFIGTISKNGTDGDGMLTLILGVVATFVVMKGKSRKVALGVLVVAALIAAFDIVDVMSTSEDGIEASVGVGLWIVALGAVTGIYGLISELRSA